MIRKRAAWNLTLTLIPTLDAQRKQTQVGQLSSMLHHGCRNLTLTPIFR
jgi:hypothetical protein